MSFTITNTMTTLRRTTTVQGSCYTAICTALGDRFGTRFWVQNTGGSCMTMMARLEGGFALVITDCEDTLSPVGWHLEGSAKGFYVGVYRTTQDADGTDADVPDQFASAYSETAEPTAEAIGDLICAALKNAAIHPGQVRP
jgi:hypothetical protein